jgi:hypothetical protein
MLSRSGYRLLTASTGEEALAIFRARQAPPRLGREPQ